MKCVVYLHGSTFITDQKRNKRCFVFESRNQVQSSNGTLKIELKLVFSFVRLFQFNGVLVNKVLVFLVSIDITTEMLASLQ